MDKQVSHYHPAMGKHEKTLQKMQQHPRPSNILWDDVEKMLISFGGKVKEGRGSAISITLEGQKAFFHRPHPGNKADKGAIETALNLLKKAKKI